MLLSLASPSGPSPRPCPCSSPHPVSYNPHIAHSYVLDAGITTMDILDTLEQLVEGTAADTGSGWT